MYVQTVLDVHKKYNALVMSAFNNDAGFVAALDKVGMWAGSFGVGGGGQRPLTGLCVIAGLWAFHQQQRGHQNGSVVQQVP